MKKLFGICLVLSVGAQCAIVFTPRAELGFVGAGAGVPAIATGGAAAGAGFSSSKRQRVAQEIVVHREGSVPPLDDIKDLFVWCTPRTSVRIPAVLHRVYEEQLKKVAAQCPVHEPIQSRVSSLSDDAVTKSTQKLIRWLVSGEPPRATISRSAHVHDCLRFKCKKNETVLKKIASFVPEASFAADALESLDDACCGKITFEDDVLVMIAEKLGLRAHLGSAVRRWQTIGFAVAAQEHARSGTEKLFIKKHANQLQRSGRRKVGTYLERLLCEKVCETSGLVFDACQIGHSQAVARHIEQLVLAVSADGGSYSPAWYAAQYLADLCASSNVELVTSFVPHIQALVNMIGVGGDYMSSAHYAVQCLKNLAKSGNAEVVTGLVLHIPTLVAAVRAGGGLYSPASRAAECLSGLAASGSAEVVAALVPHITALIDMVRANGGLMGLAVYEARFLSELVKSGSAEVVAALVGHIPVLVDMVRAGGDYDSPAYYATPCLLGLVKSGNAEVVAAMTPEMCEGLEATDRGKRVLKKIVEARRALGISSTGAGAGAGGC